MSGSFQTFTNVLQAPGLAGDFATSNPRASAISTEAYNNAGFIAGPSGLTIGLFAWILASDRRTLNNFGAGAPNGFVHRDANALITTYLNAYGYTIPAGFGTGALYAAGDFWVVNSGSAMATPGMKAYANVTTGVATFAATGAPTTSGVSAATATISAQTGSFTGSIADNLMTITAVGSGTVVVGGTMAGTGVATGTQVISQVSGTTGGVGVYLVSPRDQTVASTTITETYGLFSPGTLASGSFGVGQTLSGSGVTTGTYITAANGASNWTVSPTQTAASETITGYTNAETGWYCRSVGQPGDVVKISSLAMG
jgi:hypothetical protein